MDGDVLKKERNVKMNGSLEVLIAEFKMKFGRIETDLQFLDVLNSSSEGGSTLREIRDNVYELQAMNKAIKSRLDSAKEDFNELKKKMERLSAVRSSINQIYCSLPKTPLCEQNSLNGQNSSVPAHAEKTLTIKNQLEELDKENTKPKRLNAKSKSIKILQHDDFLKLPKHVKGHLNLEQINGGVHEINTILGKKYEFLKRPAKSLSLSDKKKRCQYLEMGKDLKGTEYEVFFMDCDIQRYGTTMKTKPRTRDGVFLVLRHLGKLKEVKRGKPSRYCILGG